LGSQKEIPLNSEIGSVFKKNSTRAVLACFVTIIVLLIDLVFGTKHPFSPVRLGYSFLGIFILLVIGRNDYKSLGLSLVPKQGFKYWLRMTIIFGLSLGALMLLYYGTTQLLGIPQRSTGTPPQLNAFLYWLLKLFILAPLFEEPIYRVILGSGLRAVLPSWSVVLIGGIAFAALHFLYGGLDMSNALAGFVLTWVFLQSESITIPILLHILGNFCVMVIWVLSWSL
jgi:membrane protease YdiL (CAAX protease family)